MQVLGWASFPVSASGAPRGVCTPQGVSWEFKACVRVNAKPAAFLVAEAALPSSPRDDELPLVRAQRNHLCDLLGLPRPRLVPKVTNRTSPSGCARDTWGPPRPRARPADGSIEPWCLATVGSTQGPPSPGVRWGRSTARPASQPAGAERWEGGVCAAVALPPSAPPPPTARLGCPVEHPHPGQALCWVGGEDEVWAADPGVRAVRGLGFHFPGRLSPSAVSGHGTFFRHPVRSPMFPLGCLSWGTVCVGRCLPAPPPLPLCLVPWVLWEIHPPIPRVCLQPLVFP